jgi:hypothetical protein
VEYSIQRLLPIIAEEREKHRKRKEIGTELTDYIKLGENLLQRSKKELGDDDPLTIQVDRAMRVCRNLLSNVNHLVEKGKQIEDF